MHEEERFDAGPVDLTWKGRSECVVGQNVATSTEDLLLEGVGV